MYCPSCEVEYRDGFFTCTDCNVALVPRLPEKPPPRDVEAPADEVEVFRSQDPLEAEMVGGALDEEGIEHLRRNQMSSGLQLTAIETHWAPGQWRVIRVPRVAEVRAREIVREITESAGRGLEAAEPIPAAEPRKNAKRTAVLLILVPLLVALLFAVLSLVEGFLR